ncbi:MAG: 50S ribosomal protein L24 [Candidatus Shikimatogenerans bostrichidophilus]|nr:MAG: 50S ribosomal protein L24 [Candidatus Shikimatogenerans bostrichidophilus]
MFKFKKGDKIIIISGKYKGFKGKINKIFKKENKVNVSGIKKIKRFIKKKTKKDKGSIKLKPYKINISNIAIEDPIFKTVTRIGFKLINGEKKRICKKSKTILNNNFIYKKK